MKKILVTSTDLMMLQFLAPHIKNLKKQGYEVEIACSEVGGRFEEVKTLLGEDKLYKVRLNRSPFKLSNFKGLSDLKKIINSGKYDLVWTNEPVMGVMTRLASKKARKNGTKVLYMAHGFHFYKGAPKLNWIIYYPIEKLMAKHTDVIVTINKEDYSRALTFKTKAVKYIHGIGLNTDRLKCSEGCNSLREELNIDDKSIILLSIGELNDNKNQETALRAFAQIESDNLHYVLCGKGDKLEYLKALAIKLGVENRTHFLGYRKDVVDICFQSNIYVMPSKREGLGIACLEAMYTGLSLITSNVGGLVDIVEDGVSGFTHNHNDVDGFAGSIKTLLEDEKLRETMGETNTKKVQAFCLENTKNEVLEIVKELIN